MFCFFVTAITSVIASCSMTVSIQTALKLFTIGDVTQQKGRDKFVRHGLFFCCRVWDEEMTVACFYLNALLPWHTVISLQHEPSVNFTPKVEYVAALETEKRVAEVAKETHCIWLAHVAAETCVGPSIEQILRVWTSSCGSSRTAPQRTGRDPLGGSERCRDFGPLITWSARWRHASAPTAAVSVGPCVNTLVVLWILSYKTTPGGLSPLIRGDEILAGQRSAAAVAS